ncbi:DNA-binding response regulator [Oxalicibacterium flavum]|uniref:DNA-binding response regulator n=1 Tax=Oxalicibacterium flavum TaxID=179467 RepID=A0A8J2UPA9_9BURK|nr:response regulator [Oxalicibacterium flavum]GGB99654.1 DNA-binding response regulator [Oxalicibacterium flavum]
MSKSDHILVVDDDPEIRQLLSDYLQSSDYRVWTAADGKEMRQVLATVQIDLIVLDVMMPDEDGLALCRELRVRHETPVIMLTARGSPVDRIVGLEVGADDYMPKPFDPRELVARIKAVLKRARSYPFQSAREEPAFITFSGWRLDTRARQVQTAEGPVISLGSSDYMVLRTLLDHANRPLSREYLLNNVYSKESLPFDRSIDVCVSRLRQHLEENPRHPALIRTVRNTGYMLTAEVAIEQ